MTLFFLIYLDSGLADTDIEESKGFVTFYFANIIFSLLKILVSTKVSTQAYTTFMPMVIRTWVTFASKEKIVFMQRALFKIGTKNMPVLLNILPPMEGIRLTPMVKMLKGAQRLAASLMLFAKAEMQEIRDTSTKMVERITPSNSA